MLKVLTAAQMREVDRLTTERYGIPSILLMENAAHAVARVITEKLGGSVKGKSILILCGPGNNGGDGAALGRLLWRQGAFVTVELFGTVKETRGDAKVNFEALDRIVKGGAWGGSLWFREESTDIADHGFDDWLARSNFDQSEVVVDALFGTGLSRELTEFFGWQAETLHNWKTRYNRPLFVSVDIPSGLVADKGIRIGENFAAHVTVTFTTPKMGNVVAPASTSNGELVIAEIGSPAKLVEEQPSELLLAEASDASEWLEQSEFTSGSYKNKRGHALIIAGSKNYSGAAVLCGDAAIRSGCGLVTIATPDSSRESIVTHVSPEVIVRGLSETDEGAVAERAGTQVKDFLKNVDVVAIGSGLSTNEETAHFVRMTVAERTTPVLIDADGLTALSPWAQHEPALGNGGDLHPLVLTPHEGEFRTLLGLDKQDFEELIKDRVGMVRLFAVNHKVFLILKGERVLIGHPDGRVVVNPTGNSGLGKAGNGDTLTGILAGFLAQAIQMKIDIFETIVAAVYIAGMAGDVAENKYGKRVMTASDVRDCLVDVFEELAG